MTLPEQKVYQGDAATAVILCLVLHDGRHAEACLAKKRCPCNAIARDEMACTRRRALSWVERRIQELLLALVVADTQGTALEWGRKDKLKYTYKCVVRVCKLVLQGLACLMCEGALLKSRVAPAHVLQLCTQQMRLRDERRVNALQDGG